ncbi:MAG: arsenate reductase ArsC [Thermoplasmata archaeon]
MSRIRPRRPGTEQTVLFVCVENACRSLMAEAIFNAHAPAGWRANSAGTRPAAAPNARTAPMLNEIGVELPRHTPQLLTPDLLQSARICVTMGCLDDASCPAFLRAVEVRDWGLPNPSDLDDSEFRGVRDRLVALIEALRGEPPIGRRKAVRTLPSASR